MKQYSNRFAVVVLICLKEIIFYILSLLNFLCLKYMNFLFSTVGCNIAANSFICIILPYIHIKIWRYMYDTRCCLFFFGGGYCVSSYTNINSFL